MIFFAFVLLKHINEAHFQPKSLNFDNFALFFG